MSLWKQNKVKKQQRKKRARKVFKARDEILSLLAADKVKKAGETASALLVKHPGDIRAWRLVAGVKAWERFGERIRGIPARRKEELKSRALKVMKRELSSRDNLRAEVLAETLISLVPAGEVMAEEEAPVAVEETPVVAEAGEKPAEKAPAKKPAAPKKTTAPKKTETAKKPPAKEAAKKSPAPKKTETAKKPAAKKSPAKKASTPAKKSPAPKKTETAKKPAKKETARKSPAKKKTK
jgi:hypothetical protein